MRINRKVKGTRLTPIRYIGRVRQRNNWYYIFRYMCECGKTIERRSTYVGARNKQAKSCGCLRVEYLEKLKSDPVRNLHPNFIACQFKKGNRPKNAFKKGNRSKNAFKNGSPAHNKGKIAIYENNLKRSTSKRRYITLQELTELYYIS